LRDLLGGSHDSISVQQQGWTGIRNGDLLRLATGVACQVKSLNLDPPDPVPQP